MESGPAQPGPGADAAPAARAAFAQAGIQADGRGGASPSASGAGSQPPAGAAPHTPDPSDGDLAERAKYLASQAIDGATATTDRVREQIVAGAAEQQSRAADTVDKVADTLHRAAEAMPADQAWLSDLTERGGERLSDFAETLRRNDLQGLLRRVDGFAREQPALFLGATFAAGFALARVAQVSVAQAARGAPAQAGSSATRDGRADTGTNQTGPSATTDRGMSHG